MENKEKITGRFERVIFQNKENYYTVAFFIVDNLNFDEITVVGHIPDLDYDSDYKLFGEYVEHKKYGIQFSFDRFEKLLANDEDALIKFLSSDLFVGIGKKTAQTIFDSLGENLVEKIKEDNSIVKDIPISKRLAKILVDGINNSEGNFERVVAYFSAYGLSVNQILKIEKAYGDKAISLVEENPYRLMEDIVGIGFKSADKLAKKINFDQNSIHRKEAILIQRVLDQGSRFGDSYIDNEELQKAFVKEGFDIDIYMQVLMNVLSRRTLVMDNEKIYHHTQYDSEQTIASALNLFPQRKLSKIEDDQKDAYLKLIQDEIGIVYDKSQLNAIKKFLDADLSILTGGPGTGKTTIIKAMVLMYKQMFPNISIALSAPTGRAAKRLSELADSEALTIHSMLKWDIDSNTFGKNEENLLDYDILIIDEFSMVDQWLFSKLLIAAKNVKKILLVGDENQLPSVLPGAVLRDLISSELFPVEKLSKIYRQKDGSSVINLADKINKSNYSDIEFKDEVRFIQASKGQVNEGILQIIENYLNQGYSIDEIQVLAPMYKGASGINILNNQIQEVFNPKTKDKKEFKYGYKLFREGDKLLQLKNLIDEEVYNGDIGRLVEIDDSDKFDVKILVDFDGNFVSYSKDSLGYLTHAYTTSIHKSQGSEYPIVVMPIVSSSVFMLRKKLLYTAITRSKKNLILIGDKQLFLNSVQKEERHKRKTTLKENLKKFLTVYDL